MKKLHDTPFSLSAIDLDASQKKFLATYKNSNIVKALKLQDKEILEYSALVKKAVDCEQQCLKNHDHCGNGGFHYVLYRDGEQLALKVESCPNFKQQDALKNIINHYELKEMTNVDFDLKIDNFQHQAKDLLEIKDLILKNKQNIYIYNQKNDMTSAISALTNELAAQNYKIGFFNMIDFVAYATIVSFEKNSQLFELNEKLKNVDVLVLDEVGNEKFQRFINFNILYTIFNYRNIHKKPIIFISQYELKDLKKQYELQTISKEYPAIQHYTQRIHNIVNRKVFKF